MIDRGVCWLCGRLVRLNERDPELQATRDHVTPVVKEQKGEPSLLALAHARCNVMRSAALPGTEAFNLRLRAIDAWWRKQHPDRGPVPEEQRRRPEAAAATEGP